ncbi:MAG: hypothetical protein OXC60_00545, partial [Litoreibacter sp.]|nr:hypothetical protein [Litoreibacter sp.]
QQIQQINASVTMWQIDSHDPLKFRSIQSEEYIFKTAIGSKIGKRTTINTFCTIRFAAAQSNQH